MPHFEHIEYLYGLLIIPIIYIIFGILRIIRRSALKKLGNPDLISVLMPDSSFFKQFLKISIFAAAVFFAVLAVANPQIGTKPIEVKKRGVDVIVALDVSRSMAAEDVKPSRLERAKLFISRLVDKLSGDRLAIVAFAGQANVLLPITTDYSAAKMFLETVDPESVSSQGTAIGDAIDLCVESFKSEAQSNKNKAIVLISDGEDHVEGATEAAEKAVKAGFVIHTIAIGTPQGAPIPIYSNGNISGFLKDDDGSTVITKLMPDVLINIAAKSGGKFITAIDNDASVDDLLNNLSGMKQNEYNTKEYSEYESRYQYFLAISFALLLIDFLISERRNKLLTKILKLK